MDKCDYLRSPIMKKTMFLVLTSGKFLEALGCEVRTGSIFCLSFSLSNRVGCYDVNSRQLLINAQLSIATKVNFATS